MATIRRIQSARETKQLDKMPCTYGLFRKLAYFGTARGITRMVTPLRDLINFKPSGHYMYRTVVTICTASGHYMYRTVVTICTASSHYMYRTVVTICTASGHYIYRTVVTICTASLTFNNSTFCPHSCIYVFCVDLRTNSHYFPIQH